MMAHAAGFFDGKFQHLLGAGGKVDLATPVLPGPGQAFDHFLHPLRFQPKFAQHAPGDTAFFSDQTQEQVFGANVILAHPFSFLVSQAEHPARSLGKTFHSSQGNTS